MNKKQLALTIILFFFGILTTTQYRSHVSSYSDLENQEQEYLATMARELTTKKRLIDSEITELERSLYELENSNSSSKVIVENLSAEINNLRKINSTVPVKGPGIILTIDNSSPVIYTDLVKIINELWNSGAEAISVNDIRVTSRTYFYQSDETYQMTINTNLLDPPYSVKALGNPQVLKTGIELPGGIIDNLKLFGIYPEIKTIPEISLPGADSIPSYSYAKEIN